MISFRSLVSGQFVAVAIALSTTASFAADKRPMQVEDLYKFKRVAAPQVSPDGKNVAYSLTTVSLTDNKSSTALWIGSTEEKRTPPRPLTDPKGKKDNNPRWS